jgi:surfactin family lipopeptide synthetase A
LQSSKASSGERTLQFASFSFDVSFQEIFSTWCSGSTLVLVSDEIRRDDERLLGFLREEKINRLFVPFVMLQQLAERAGSKDELPESLREIITAGEQLRITPQIKSLFTKLNHCALHNHYGPTETHAATSFILSDRIDEWSNLPPIGRPLPHARVYILDKEMEPVPIGVPGELYIGGDGLARGYIDRAELTAERFLPDPFVDRDGARLYRSGDLVRYLQDGNIEFLGRADHQVKVRGFRVEPGEIEILLKQHESVKDAAVVALEKKSGEKQLVAYLVGQAGATTSVSELRSFLKERLPDYMIPSKFVLLDRLPLTLSGKVDRRALPPPEAAGAEMSDDYMAPRDLVEEVTAVIWSNILGIEKVGIKDNFFELGGHSLLATRLISRIRETFHVEMPLRSLFEEPTVSGIARSIKAAISAGEKLQSPPLLPVSREEKIPLSFAQQRLWFLNYVDSSNGAYNLHAAVRILGNLDLKALEESFRAIVDRHESLRTNFALVDGEPLQIISSSIPVELPVLQLLSNECTDNSTRSSSDGLAEPVATAPGTVMHAERDREVNRLASEEASKPFDLSQEPLIRVKLLRSNEDEHVLLLTMHHIVSDGWSISVFINEMAALYEAISQGLQSPLPELPIQYADFAKWQRGWMKGDLLEQQLAYWRRQLGGELPSLSLPIDRPRPPVQTFRGAFRSFLLSKDLSERLKELSRSEGATQFMTLLAIFKILLYRYSGQEDIVVGTPIANRNRAEIEQLIGFFVNTLALRTNLKAELSFRQLLERVRETSLGAYAHQDIPFEKVVEELQPERDVSRSPLFQVMFALQNLSAADMKLKDLTLIRLEPESDTTKFDLTLAMEETEEGFAGSFEFNRDLFDATTIERMIGHFKTLIEAILSDPDEKISRLALLTPAERHQLLVEWNDTRVDYQKEKCIHELFEDQVMRTPDAIALTFEDEQLSYRELNARANQLAHYLRSLGVGAETLVGICVERSIEMVVGLLAILKAGGAYLPLDPAYPKERIDFMLEDAGVEVLLTDQLATKDTKSSQILVPFETCCGNYSRENPISISNPENLAYVIYTSGSTGRPKGVEVEHSSLLNLVSWHQHAYSIEPSDRATQIAGPAFDASVWEIWPYLASGASIHIPDEQTRSSPSDLVKWLADEAITICFMPTPLAEAALEMEWPSGTALRALLTGGDKLHRRPDAHLPFLLINHYGPTEGTVVTTSGLVGAESPSIGRPIANIRTYLLDPNLQPVPVGVAGEIYIGGAGLARGYLNRADLTAERFITDPFSNEPGARLYRTGDLARYLPNGEIEFIGRIDDQVKIRGFRIELGEIESALYEHPAVRESVAIAIEDSAGEKRLAAFVVSDRERVVSTVELRNFLKERLPQYMVPASLVILDELPLTSNGKVDRKSLSAMENRSIVSEAPFVAPETELERAIAAIWTEVLKVDKVSVYDNFFDLGGHSLAMVQVHTKLKAIYHKELSIIEMFKQPTINTLAKALSQDLNGVQKQQEGHKRGRARRESIAELASRRPRA